MEPSAAPSAYLVSGLRRLIRDLASEADSAPDIKGLSDVICGRTELFARGNSGVHYAGLPVADLVETHSFESVIWLLFRGECPTEEELSDCCSIMADTARLDATAVEILSHMPVGVRPLELFPLCLSLLAVFDPPCHESHEDASCSVVLRILAQLPIMLSTALSNCCVSVPAGRSGSSEETMASQLSAAESELSWAGRLLLRLRPAGQRPTVSEEAAMNVLLICECLTEMRPACFASRFAAGTRVNVSAALQSAATIFSSQLRNDPFLWTSDLLRGFRDPKQVEAWWLRREGQAMPFGFDMKNNDNRVTILNDTCRGMLGSIDRIRVEAVAARLEKIQAVEDLHPTTDWCAARLMTLLDIPSDRQSLVIAVARLVGWAAQFLEQLRSPASLLPSLQYGD